MVFGKSYGFVVCDSYEVVSSMEEYGDAIFSFTRYFIMMVALYEE